MSSGIHNKHVGYCNRRSIRLRGCDYSRPGYYFVTICVHDRKKYLFGDVVRGEMVLNDTGGIVKRCWHEIPSHFPYVEIDEFVVMPNHVHGIIHIRDLPDFAGPDVGANNHSPLPTTDTNAPNNHSPLQTAPNEQKDPSPNELVTLIRSFP